MTDQAPEKTRYKHVRSDIGLKRGPKYPHKPPVITTARGTWVIPKELDPRAVLDQYLAAETTSHIAEQYGLARSALVKWLRDVVPDEWKKVQIIRAMCRKDDGESGIAGASDALALARAREMLRSGQWELEKLDKEYAPKQEVTVELNIDLGDRLRRARERVIEADPVLPSTPNSNTTKESGTCALPVRDVSQIERGAPGKPGQSAEPSVPAPAVGGSGGTG